MASSPRRIVLATGNPGKLVEIRELLDGRDIEIVAQSEFDFLPAEESGATFLENALLKARHAAAETGLTAIADDSGLVVDALDGAPGIFSARFAGDDATDEENVAKLLKSLEGVEQRGASFRCVAVVVFPDENRQPIVGEGEWRGRIATSPCGDGGFGYDPVFFDIELGKCAAEMTAEEKNVLSHRGGAFRGLVGII